MSDPFEAIAGMPDAIKIRLIKSSANIVGHTVATNRERYVAMYAAREELSLDDADTAVTIMLDVLAMVHKDIKAQL